MSDSVKALRDILSNSKYLDRPFAGEEYFRPIISIISRIDVVSSLRAPSDVSQEDEAEVRELFSQGWGALVKQFYSKLNYPIQCPLSITTRNQILSTDNEILLSGKLGLCRHFLDFVKAGIIDLRTEDNKTFYCRYKHSNPDIERFDRMSFDFFREKIVEQAILEKQKKNIFDEKAIRKQLKSIINNPLGQFISYHTTNDIDEYYNKIGHYHILRLQGYDDFDTKDIFGGIEYWRYVDIIELITGTAFMHMDACMELVNRNPQTDLHNIISYIGDKRKIIDTYASYLDLPHEEIEQIFSCITLTKENAESYLQGSAVPLAPYFQVSETQIVRSIAGCLDNPFKILNSELKRKFRRDYDIAVTKREERFRKELFYLFPQDKVIKIPRGINISNNEIHTDIDAVLYDRTSRTLGLVQIKWQDPFGFSMKERYSRISNLFPKANEWVGKMNTWIQNNSAKTILNSLRITDYAPEAKEIGEVCIFVLTRNHMHFTGVYTDKSVAWASWYQLIEAQASIKAMFDDPIRELFVKIQLFTPEERTSKEEKVVMKQFPIEFDEYKIIWE